MARQERVQKTSVKQSEAVKTEVSVDTKEALKAEMDDVLDTIDGVLEENAEEFVKGFVQKGGE